MQFSTPALRHRQAGGRHTTDDRGSSDWHWHEQPNAGTKMKSSSRAFLPATKNVGGGSKQASHPERQTSEMTGFTYCMLTLIIHMSQTKYFPQMDGHPSYHAPGQDRLKADYLLPPACLSVRAILFPTLAKGSSVSWGQAPRWGLLSCSPPTPSCHHSAPSANR